MWRSFSSPYSLALPMFPLSRLQGEGCQIAGIAHTERDVQVQQIQQRKPRDNAIVDSAHQLALVDSRDVHVWPVQVRVPCTFVVRRRHDGRAMGIAGAMLPKRTRNNGLRAGARGGLCDGGRGEDSENDRDVRSAPDAPTLYTPQADRSIWRFCDKTHSMAPRGQI
jgi:hypothetical protein